MGNTWNGMLFTNIARTGLKAYVKRLMSIGVFSLDLSANLVEQGTVVQTRIVPAADAAVDLQTGVAVTAGDREDTNIIKDVTTTSVPVTLNQQPIAGFALTDEEAMQIGSGVWEDTKNKLIESKAYAVANFVLKYCFDLVTAANYAGAVLFTGAASAFDMDDVVDAGSTLSEAGWPVDRNSMVLVPSYRGALKKDNAVQDLSASGIQVVQNGELSRLDRFQIVEAPTLVDADVYGASEYVRGFACTPDAMAIAMRAVESQATDQLMAFEIMNDPDTGVTLVYRAWYKQAFGKVYHTFETLFGASKANTAALRRIVSQ